MRIILRGNEPSPRPEGSNLGVDRIDDQRAASNQVRCRDAALERMLDQAGAYTFANPTLVGRKLPQQQTGHRIRRLAGPDGTRQGGGDDRRRRKTVIADDTIHLVNDHDCREALLLLGQCARSAFCNTIDANRFIARFSETPQSAVNPFL